MLDPNLVSFGALTVAMCGSAYNARSVTDMSKDIAAIKEAVASAVAASSSAKTDVVALATRVSDIADFVPASKTTTADTTNNGMGSGIEPLKTLVSNALRSMNNAERQTTTAQTKIDAAVRSLASAEARMNALEARMNMQEASTLARLATLESNLEMIARTVAASSSGPSSVQLFDSGAQCVVCSSGKIITTAASSAAIPSIVTTAITAQTQEDDGR